MAERQDRLNNSQEQAYGGLRAHFRNLIDMVDKTSSPLRRDQVTRLQSNLRIPTIDGLHKFVNRAFPLQDVEKNNRHILNNLRELWDNPSSRMGIIDWTDLFLYYAIAVTKIQSSTPDVRANNIEGSAVKLLLNERIAWAASNNLYPELVKDPNISDKMYSIGRIAVNDADVPIAFCGAHIQGFASNLGNFFHLRSQIEKNKMESDQITTRELRQGNDQLFHETRLLQKYGVKPAIAPALSDSFANEWQISDPFVELKLASEISRVEARNLDSPTKYSKPSLASFYSTLGRFKTSKSNMELSIGSRKGLQIFENTVADQLEEGSFPGFSFDLGSDGELQTFMGGSLREFFASTKNHYQYELLRAEALAIYADLVTPAYISEVVKQEMGTEIIGEREKKRKIPELYRMVLARQRVIKSMMPDIISSLESGDDEVEDKKGKGKRQMVRHSVIDSIVKLQEGCRASDEARELAKSKFGIILAETGETYRRRHERGNLPNPSLGHRVVFEKPSEPRISRDKS